MPVVVIVGAQWGDEGKGKVVDMLAEKAQVVVRFSGGDNAGHTVINPTGEFKLHLVPSGIFYPGVTCVIGNGVVVNPAKLIEEIDALNRSGVDTRRLVISDRAHVVMPYHIIMDELEERSRAGKALGTTRRGIGPAFTDKIARQGIRIGELLDKEGLKERLSMIIETKNDILTRIYGVEPLSLPEIYKQCCQYGDRLAPYIRETITLLRDAQKRNDMIILEGAQGALLDPDFGTYPYATSSSPLSAGGCLGSGISPKSIDKVIGVYKAYCTRVGNGPMPTELNDEVGEAIRVRAHEFGTTTGRPRRCGWFDGVAARFSSQLNGFTGGIITRIDVLDELPKLKICIAYELDGRIIDYIPASASEYDRCKPVYEELDGWQTSTEHIRRYQDLPIQARKYIKRMEDFMDCPVNFACIGPTREQTIPLNPIF